MGPPSIWARMMDPPAQQASFHKKAMTTETGLVWIPLLFMKESSLSTTEGPSRWVTNEKNVIVYLRKKNIFCNSNHCLTLSKEEAKINDASQV